MWSSRLIEKLSRSLLTSLESHPLWRFIAFYLFLLFLELEILLFSVLMLPCCRQPLDSLLPLLPIGGKLVFFVGPCTYLFKIVNDSLLPCWIGVNTVDRCWWTYVCKLYRSDAVDTRYRCAGDDCGQVQLFCKCFKL